MSRVSAAQRPTEVRSGRRRLLVATALACVIAVAAAGWWTHPSYFRDHGAAVGMAPRPVAEATMHVGIVSPLVGEDDAEAVVALRGLEASFAVNTAAATASFAICEGGGVGAVNGDLAEFCTGVAPIEDGTELASVRGSEDQLIMTITPTRPGKVKVDAVTLDYALDRSHLWRRGEQTIAVDVTLTAR